MAVPLAVLVEAGAEVFCLAIFARASRIEEPLATGAAAGAGAGAPVELCRKANADAGGLPGGVVDVSKSKDG